MGQMQEGLGSYQVTQKNGERWSVARAYIHPHRRRPNLRVLTHARARRVLFSGRRARGIEVAIKGADRIGARREVIISAGALQSPQLLLLSGIGSAATASVRN